jgi:hypothetical protein
MTFNIVIVSPIEHWAQCKVLLDSIDRHLVAHRVYLIDNTPSLGLPKYKLKNNHLHQIPWSDLIISRTRKNHTIENGWITQQLLKLAVYQLFKSETYVCLDTKNIVLSNIINWPVDNFPGVPHPYHDFYKFYNSTCKLFELDHRSVKPPQTPYILNSHVVSNMINFWGSWDMFQDWFTDFTHPSEFWLYDLWCQKNRVIHVRSLDNYEPTILHLYRIHDWKKFLNSKSDKKYEMASIWRPVWEHSEFQPYIEDLNFLKIFDQSSK